MFKFLKDKLKGAIDKITKKVEEAPDKEVVIEETISEPIEEIKEVKVEKPKKPKKKKAKEKGIVEELKEKEQELEAIEELKSEIEEKKEEKHNFFDFLKRKKETLQELEVKPETEEVSEIKEEKKGILQVIKEKVTTKVISEKQFDELFYDLEIGLLENNVAVKVIEKIKNDLKKDLTNKPIKKDKIKDEVKESLRNSIESLFDVEQIDLIELIKEKKEKPFVIVFFGINGSGKTSSIAKLAHMLKNHKISCVISASDTFRAAAIQQLEEHASKLDVKLIKYDYGSDPAAVAFDAIKHAQAKLIDVVLIDTAGRLHSNINLIDEMKKIVRVTKPDLKIFVGESITGNDCVEQAQKFNNSIGIDGIILAKADVDDRGGTSISISYVTKKPILYLGTGQKYDDLKEFRREEIIKQLNL